MSNRYEFVTPPAIASYAGLIVGIWGVIQNHLFVSLFASVILNVVALIYLYIIYRRYSVFKRYLKCDREFHRLTHRTRDYVTLLRASDDSVEAGYLQEQAIKNVLSVASSIFSRVTKVECTASLMLKNGNKLQTTLYCHQVDPARLSIAGKPISSSKGVAGEAIQTGKVVSWNINQNNFEKSRDDNLAFYQSGLSVPFKSGFEYSGLLNIDSMSEGIFDLQQHREFASMLADMLGLVIDTYCLKSEP